MLDRPLEDLDLAELRSRLIVGQQLGQAVKRLVQPVAAFLFPDAVLSLKVND